MRSGSRSLGVLAVHLALAGCAAKRPAPTPLQVAEYERQLARFIHDSALIDSLAGLARTDSLYRLYRLALRPSGADSALVNAIGCEWTRLSFLHGNIPAQHRIHTLLDTVFADMDVHGWKKAERYFLSLAPRTFIVSTRACGRLPPFIGDVVDGTRVDVEPVRPRAP